MHQVTFKPYPVLTTGRLTLRQLDSGDEPVLFRLRSDNEVLKYQDRQPAETLEDVRQFIRKINGGIVRDEWIFWAVTLNTDHQLLGTICLWNIAPDELKAEVGYELLPDHQGKGIMQEALQAVIRYGFDTLHLQTIEAYVNPQNAKSIKLLERSAFIHSGTYKESDDFDMEIYVLLSPRR